MIRSILAILAGIAVLTGVSFAIEAVANPLMMRMFPVALPNQAALSHNLPAKISMLAYTMVCVAAGGYVTAWLARQFEVRHAVIMGVIEVALTIAAMRGLPEHAPAWTWAAAFVLTVPAAWFGGMTRANRTKGRDVPRGLRFFTPTKNPISSPPRL